MICIIILNFSQYRANEFSFAHTDVYKTKALLSHTGEISWAAPVTWRVSCEFDITWFPLDKQVYLQIIWCFIILNSTPINSATVNLVKIIDAKI